MKVFQFLIVCSIVVVALSCSPASSTEPVPTEAATNVSPPIDFHILDFSEARSHSLAAGPDGSLYLIFGQDHSLFVSRSTDGGQSFGEVVLASGERLVHVLPIEHPAIAVDSEGQVHIAWLEMLPDFNGAEVWYAVSRNGGETFQPGQLVANEPEGEVAMVQVALDSKGHPFLMWLNESELKFARAVDTGSTFSEAISIGDGSCECCQPQAVALDDNIHIAYRSLEQGSETGDIRDIVMISSADKGHTFGNIARVSDAHWYLPACPIAGPSLAVHDGSLFVTWMDGRFEPAGTFSRGDIWLSSSQNGGKTFSANIRMNPEQTMHHTLPTLAIGPGGRIHISWEAHHQSTREAFLYYAFSDDNAQTFTSPQIIADNVDSARGNPGKPKMVVDAQGHVTLAWLDRLGVRLATWTDPK
ncbi:MAG TPA: sialidase family protein [Anaerolineales bacterium]|nr:sialidase family protein [Anaerolineales bacterium]